MTPEAKLELIALIIEEAWKPRAEYFDREHSDCDKKDQCARAMAARLFDIREILNDR